jgi:hypothetical protein
MHDGTFFVNAAFFSQKSMLYLGMVVVAELLKLVTMWLSR